MMSTSARANHRTGPPTNQPTPKQRVPANGDHLYCAGVRGRLGVWIPVMPKALHALTIGRTPNTYRGGSDPFGMFAPAVAAIIMRLFIRDRSPWVLGMIVRRDGSRSRYRIASARAP